MIIDNINNLIKKRKWTKKDFAEKLISLNPVLKSTGEVPSVKSIYAFLNGTRGFDIEIYPYIAEVLSVPEQMLFTTNQIQLADFIKSQINEHPELYSHIVPCENEKKKDSIDLPYYKNDYVCAGENNTESATYVPKPITFDRNFLKEQLGFTNFDNLHIVNSIGNSMEPTIKEGSLLIVNPYEKEQSIISGGIYTVMYYGHPYVKRIVLNPKTKEITLFSDNETQHPPMYVDLKEDENEFHIIGRVLAHFNFL